MIPVARRLPNRIDNSLSGGGVGESEVVEQGLGVDPDGFVVSVDLGPVGGSAAVSGRANTGEDRCDHLIE